MRNRNKRGISVIVGYVLLITFVIFLGVIVYSWMRSYVPQEDLDCPDDSSLFIKDYSCSAGQLSLTLKNNGKFSLGGYFIRVTDNPQAGLATIDISSNISTGSIGGTPMYIFEDFETGTQNGALWSTYQTTTGDERILFDYTTAANGTYSVAMDDNDTGGGDYGLNVLYTNYDFTGASNIVVNFWQREFGDESDPAPNSWSGWGNYDAVAFTCDGNTWYELIDETSLSIETFTEYEVNISADPDFCSTIDSNFAIAFQQYDNGMLTGDGRAWDDINISYISPSVSGGAGSFIPPSGVKFDGNENSLAPSYDETHVFDISANYPIYSVEVIPLRWQEQDNRKRAVTCMQASLREEITCL